MEITCLYLFTSSPQPHMKVLDSMNSNVSLAWKSKAKHIWNHHTRSCLWKQQRGNRGALILSNLFFKWIMTFCMSTETTYFIKYSLKKCSCFQLPSTPQNTLWLPGNITENKIPSYRAHPHFYKVHSWSSCIRLWHLSNPQIPSLSLPPTIPTVSASWRICLWKYIIPDKWHLCIWIYLWFFCQWDMVSVCSQQNTTYRLDTSCCLR